MTFYGQDPQPKPSAELKTFWYCSDHRNDEPQKVTAQKVYFYDSGHFGFWNDTDNGERFLVLAIKANEVWEEQP